MHPSVSPFENVYIKQTQGINILIVCLSGKSACYSSALAVATSQSRNLLEMCLFPCLVLPPSGQIGDCNSDLSLSNQSCLTNYCYNFLFT